MNPIRVVIADDYALIRSGLRKELEAQGYEVIGEASDGINALALVRDLKPDVLVLDIQMPHMGGLEVMEILRTESIQKPAILILSAHNKEAYIMRALAVGANGYMLKEEALTTIVTGVRTVATGRPWFSPKIMVRITSRAIQNQNGTSSFPPKNFGRPLTPKENQVLQLIARGWSNPQIAKQLSIEESTVKKHLSHIFIKMGVKKRMKVVLRALILKVITLEDIAEWVM